MTCETITITVKSGDNKRPFDDTLTIDGVAQSVNLTGATVLFLLKKSGGVVFSDAATIQSAVDGTVRYERGPTFPTAVGRYRQEWEVTFADGKIETFPQYRYNEIRIIEDLN